MTQPTINLIIQKNFQNFKLFLCMLNNSQKEIILNVTAKIKPTMIGIFGSYARGDEQKNSDLDILIDFDSRIDLLELIGLEMELSQLLGIPVDLVTKRSVHLEIYPYIEKDLVRIL